MPTPAAPTPARWDHPGFYAGIIAAAVAVAAISYTVGRGTHHPVLGTSIAVGALLYPPKIGLGLFLGRHAARRWSRRRPAHPAPPTPPAPPDPQATRELHPAP